MGACSRVSGLLALGTCIEITIRKRLESTTQILSQKMIFNGPSNCVMSSMRVSKQATQHRPQAMRKWSRQAAIAASPCKRSLRRRGRWPRRRRKRGIPVLRSKQSWNAGWRHSRSRWPIPDTRPPQHTRARTNAGTHARRQAGIENERAGDQLEATFHKACLAATRQPEPTS